MRKVVYNSNNTNKKGAKPMKHILSLLLAVAFMLCACTSPEEPESEETQEPVESVESSDLPEDVGGEEPLEDNTEEYNLFNITDISKIPYYGNSENIRLPKEHALAYAEAISDVKLDFGEKQYSFDTFYPVLIDVSGDGIPLLLLAVEEHESFSDYFCVWNILFGYTDGALQRITEFPLGVGVSYAENETLLVLMWESDSWSTYDWYRVNNGAAEFIFTDSYEAWRNEGVYRINDVDVSEEEFNRAMFIEAPNRFEHLLSRGHTGYVFVDSAFTEYLQQLFTREQVEQIFRDYAETLEP